MMRGKLAMAVVAGLVAFCGAAQASGILVPEGRNLPPLAIKNHRVTVTVEDGVATTKVVQVFLNSTNRRLEATYIFPIPADAALTDFAMFINGKRQSGEVVEAGRARQIYEDIVRRIRDPGLLEYLNSGLLRMRVFPIEPKSDTTVELSYSQTLRFDAGVYEYTFPLKTGTKASQVLEDFTLAVDLRSRQPIKSVYCPTHDVGITRKDDHHAIVGFEETGARLDKDFTVFYTVSEDDFGLNLLTYRRPGQDGYFALMISPRVQMEAGKVMPKDVCFVLDTSGSMREEGRIESAREAVKFCLRALNPGDRFAIVPFNTTVETYGDGLTEATKQAVDRAVEYLDELRAVGGTALCEAVLTALKMAPEKGDRPYLVVLVTDGKPTIGEFLEPDQIVEQVEAANKDNVRVFTFGIAENLNVVLLDRIAETTNAYSEYVAPGREIETRISSFFRKVSNPVLSDLELDFGSIRVRDLYPQKMPDLFRGSQVVAFGRYSGEDDVAVKLTGMLEGKRQLFAYDATFPEENAANAFLAPLWARRKIGFLLDQIRLHGENRELVDEVVRLSQEHGIATPYTSYLVLENEEAYRRHGIVTGEALGSLRRENVLEEARRADGRRARAEPAAADAAIGATLFATGRAGGERAAEGEAAVSLSRALRQAKEAKALADGRHRIVTVGEKRFVMVGETYVDTAFKEDMELLKVQRFSDAYFAALEAVPELADYLALGDSVVVVIGKKALAVTAEGEEQMSAEAVREFFGK